MNGELLTRIAERAAAEKVPLEVLFEVTHRCNLPCKHCYLPDHLDHGELTFAEIEGLFDQLAAAGTLFLTLTGGEVLSRRDFCEIVEAAAARGFAVKILSNATMVTEEVARRWRDAGVLEVSVSVYGADAATHDAVTDQPGSCVRTMAGIERLRAVGIMVAMKTPLMTLNGGGARDVHELARVAGMPCRFDATITPKNDGATGPLALQLAHDALVDILSKPPFDVYAQGSDPDGPSPCNAGRAYCAIGPTGELMPCIMMPEPVGNVRTTPFAELWRRAPLFERLRGLTRDDLHACTSCDVKATCTRCPGLAQLRGQDIDGCDLSAKAVARARRSAQLRILQGAA
jgi:radical SAM protein with 4Fe4S-binding SPASM domain